VVTRSGDVAFEDVWLFGHRNPGAYQEFMRIIISPVTSTTTSPQVAPPCCCVSCGYCIACH